MKFFFRERFNYFDMVVLWIATIVGFASEFWIALVVYVIGAILSALFTTIAFSK